MQACAPISRFIALDPDTNSINGETLAQLDDEKSLTELGVTNVVHRKKIIQELQALKKKAINHSALKHASFFFFVFFSFLVAAVL